jgi:ParB/RepB/Spo0J family partition protein
VDLVNNNQNSPKHSGGGKMDTAVAVLTLKELPMAKSGAVEIQNLPLNKIKISRNSRMSVSNEELDGLMQSIKEVGLLQPIGVIKNGSGYEICYGNRRFLATSRLGLSRIPAIIHTARKEFDKDIKNLTENIQRRNLGLAEIGRYMTLLKKEGLSSKEIAVRLGVPPNYVRSCFTAFERVPEKYRNDIEVRVGATEKSQKTVPGKISIRAANAILSAKKTYGLDQKETEVLFKAAKHGDQFNPDQVKEYAAAVKGGSKEPIKDVEPVHSMHLVFFLGEKEFNRLHKKHVEDGPFKSVTGALIAALNGGVNERVKMIENKK